MYDTVRDRQSPRGDAPCQGEDDDTFAPPEAIVLLVIERLTDRTDEPVPYEWVIGRARREHELDRPEVERSVECLAREGVVKKVGADRLAVA